MTTANIIVHSKAVTEWVASRVGLASGDDFGPCSSLGFGRNGKPIAGVVYSWYRREPHGNDVRATIAAERGTHWAQRDVLRHMFSYPFEQLGCARVTCLIREGNISSERLCKHLGFRKEGVMRRAWDGKSNALVYGLLKQECRYLNG